MSGVNKSQNSATATPSEGPHHHHPIARDSSILPKQQEINGILIYALQLSETNGYLAAKIPSHGGLYFHFHDPDNKICCSALRFLPFCRQQELNQEPR